MPFDEKVVDGAAPTGDSDVENLAIDHELGIMRRVFRKWCRVAGVQGSLCDELKEGEFEADWTRAIAPRLEGRIRIVGAA
jgi:5'-nucleotidase